jgi:hypothetical protein
MSGLAAIRREAEEFRAAFVKEAAELHFGAERIARGLARITAAEQARVTALAEQVIDGLGLPLEQARDQAASMGETMEFLREAMDSGAISSQRFGQVVGEMARQAETQFLTLAHSILESMGATQMAADLKAQLDEANFLMQVAQLNILFNALSALGDVGVTLQAKLRPILDYINNPANWPSFNAPPRPDTRRFLGYDDAGTTSTAANTQLDAARRFAEAVDSYVQATQDLLVDPALSILTPEQQVEQLRSQFYSTLAAAQGGDIAAVGRLGDLQRQLLEAQIRVTGGGADATGSAGYIALFQELMAAGSGLVNSPLAQQSFDLAATVQAQGEQSHRDLQTLIGIMQQIRDASGGTVYYAPEAFAPERRPERGDLGGLDRAAAGFSRGAGGGAVASGDLGELIREVRGLRSDIRDAERDRKPRENAIKENTGRTASNTAGRDYGRSRDASGRMFRTGGG